MSKVYEEQRFSGAVFRHWEIEDRSGIPSGTRCCCTGCTSEDLTHRIEWQSQEPHAMHGFICTPCWWAAIDPLDNRCTHGREDVVRSMDSHIVATTKVYMA